ncbi:MAG: 2-polyprenyl-3-methyl-5-hydroxy-6-metoxy-1,4-benzoquinol methylase [Candidatus Azotimanducaceae bacterium]|jgi:2-polyprenyl-3-methyl-5-hydroxy-6-metoxy-1,4-benzoquinol methylase
MGQLTQSDETKTVNGTTILPEEVKKFNQLADTWWDKTGPMWPLHRMNALRVRFIQAQVQHLPADCQYDVVLNMEVVQHIDDLDGFLASCGRVTKPGKAMKILKASGFEFGEFTGVGVNPVILKGIQHG